MNQERNCFFRGITCNGDEIYSNTGFTENDEFYVGLDLLERLLESKRGYDDSYLEILLGSLENAFDEDFDAEDIVTKVSTCMRVKELHYCTFVKNLEEKFIFEGDYLYVGQGTVYKVVFNTMQQRFMVRKIDSEGHEGSWGWLHSTAKEAIALSPKEYMEELANIWEGEGK